VEQYGREFVLMKYVPGVPIYQTQGWHDNVSPSGEGKRDKGSFTSDLSILEVIDPRPSGMDVKDCVQFIQEHVFETIKSTAYNYAKKFEIWHDDLFFANVIDTVFIVTANSNHPLGSLPTRVHSPRPHT